MDARDLNDDAPVEDRSFENWSIFGILFGLALTGLGLLLQILEIVRIYNGVYNYGLKNYDLSDQLQYPIGNISNSQFLFGERWHFWPWTYPGNFIGVIVMVSGLVGLISGFRKSYTMIYSFYALSLLSMLMCIFLIVYYSIMIHYYYVYKSNQIPNAELFTPWNRPDSGDESFGIVATNLSLSILTLLTALLATLLATSAGKICIKKKTYSDYYGNPRPRKIVPR